MTITESSDATAPSRVVVFSYGIHYKWAKHLPDVVVQQLRAAHSLRNDLVALQQTYEEKVKAVWSSYPQVAATETALADAEEAAEAAAEKVKAERVRQQTKRITGPVAEELKVAHAAVKAARQSRRDAIAAVRDEAKARLDDLGVERNAAEGKDGFYRTYAAEGVLYHGTFSDVLDAHRVSVRRIGKARAAGQPATLRFYRFTGEGRMLVKLQRSAGDPLRTPEVLADPAGRYRNTLHIPGWVPPAEWDQLSRAEQRKRGRVLARIRVGGGGVLGGGEVIDLPIQIDRMLPADADVTSARLVIRRDGTKTRAYLNVTAKLPPAAPVTDGPTVAVHLGWRREDAGVRVATWRATAPVSVPDALAGVLKADPDGLTGSVVIPDRLADRKERLEKERGCRDDHLNVVQARLVAWLHEHGPVPHPVYTDPETGAPEDVTAARVSQWRAPGRFAILAHHWREAPPVAADGIIGTDVADELEAWRSADKQAWDRETGGNRKLTAHRNDIYAQIAAVFGYQAQTVVLDDMRISDLARRTAADEDLPNEVAARMGHQRALAAPGMLRERIVTTCKREGVTVMVVGSENLTRAHAACGTINEPPARGHEVHCGCGRKYDVDANAVALILTRALDAPAA